MERTDGNPKSNVENPIVKPRGKDASGQLTSVGAGCMKQFHLNRRTPLFLGLARTVGDLIAHRRWFGGRTRLLIMILGGILAPGWVGWAAPGDVDTSFRFAPSPGSEILIGRIAVQPDGKILVCTAEKEENSPASYDFGKLLRLDADGSLDTGFDVPKFERANRYAGPYSVAILSDGKILVSGQFDTVNGLPHKNLVRLDANGNIDESFVCAVDADSFTRVVALPDGKILLAGTVRQPTDLLYGVLVRLNPDGTRDASFGFDGEVALDPFDGGITNIRVQEDGKILIVGNFGSVHSATRRGAARLHPDGSLDAAFEDPRVGGEFRHVFALALQPDGKVLIGGTFTSVRGVSRRGIARLNADGSLDMAFLNPGLTFDPILAGVRGLALQPDGGILIAGSFQVQARTNIARLNPNGTLDSTFNGGRRSSFVNHIALQTDGKILVTGSDCTPGVGCEPFLVRLHAEDALPSLSIDRSGGSVLLSWPVGQTGDAVLESSDSLSPLSLWNQEASAPVTVGDRHVLSIPAANGPKFFRMRK